MCAGGAAAAWFYKPMFDLVLLVQASAVEHSLDAAADVSPLTSDLMDSKRWGWECMIQLQEAENRQPQEPRHGLQTS
jgi:hypothetical protein